MVIYKTTNTINGKFYIGMDSKNDPTYLGSGSILKQSIKKHGIENFKKEIIEYCNDLNHLKERERYWIAELNCRERTDCYNIGQGGDGGDNITFNPNRDAFLRTMKMINSTSNGMTGKTHSEITHVRMKEKAVDRFGRQWHIDRYGEEEGLKKYELRNSNLSEKRQAAANHQFIEIPETDLIAFITKNPQCKLIDITKHFQVGSTCIYGKFKLFFDCKNLNEVKLKLNVV